MSDEIPQHFSIPFRLEGGAIATEDEDSLEEITDCVTNLLRTEQGWLEWLPEFGRPDWAFTRVDVAAVRDFVLRWEDRAEPEVVSEALRRVQELNVTEVATGG